jgi:hypothetical protein
MSRWYLAEIVGIGSEADPFRPASADPVSANWSAVDGRADSTDGIGWLLVRADVSTVQHATLTADPRIQYLPLEENGTGRVLAFDEPISMIRAAVRVAIAAALEAKHVPTDDFDASTTVRDLLRRVIRRCLLRQLLGADDYSELLDQTVADIPAAKRNRIAAKLTELGFDLSGFSGATTIRELLRGLATQPVKWNQTNID